MIMPLEEFGRSPESPSMAPAWPCETRSWRPLATQSRGKESLAVESLDCLSFFFFFLEVSFYFLATPFGVWDLCSLTRD